MSVHALVISDEVRAKIATLIDYATASPVSQRRLLATMELAEPPIGDDPRHVVHVPLGYRCVFSIEEQPIGLCRHLSVSVVAGALPGVQAVLLLADEFGFSAEFIGAVAQVTKGAGQLRFRGRGAVWVEEARAVNLVEPMSNLNQCDERTRT